MSRDREYVRSVSGMETTTERRRSERSKYIYGARRHVTEGLKYIVEWNVYYNITRKQYFVKCSPELFYANDCNPLDSFIVVHQKEAIGVIDAG